MPAPLNITDDAPPSQKQVLTRNVRRADAYWTYVRPCATPRVRFRPSKGGFSSTRLTESMCEMRALGLLEYMSLCRTQRLRFCSSKKRVLMRKARRVDAYWTYVRPCATPHVRFRPLKSRFSGAKRAELMCAVRAFGLLEYMSLCRTQRLRFCPPKSGFSSARRREATCTGVL